MKTAKNYISIITIIALSAPIFSQSNLENYVEQGIESNEFLKSSQYTYEAALQALEVAKSIRSVSLDFVPTYTLAAGGRRLNFPLGDIINPVYSTLNELTGSNQFPQIENVSEQLSPNNFYDLKFRATYPIMNKTIALNENVKNLEVEIASDKIDEYQQKLIADITTAYYDCQMAIQAVDIYVDAMELVEESLRVNRGLLKNGKALPIDVSIAENDSIQLAKEITNSLLTVGTAQAYLNLLVNQSFETPVEFDESLNNLPLAPTSTSVMNRPELAQLNRLTAINSQLIELEKASNKPQVNAFAEFGMQDFDFNVNEESFYIIGGVSMSLNILDGGQQKAKIKQAEATLQAHLNEKKYTTRQLEMEAFVARQQLITSFNNYDAIKKELNLKKDIYRQQQKKYKAGVANYITVQDARNELIQTSLNLNIALNKTWKDCADLKRKLAIK